MLGIINGNGEGRNKLFPSLIKFFPSIIVRVEVKNFIYEGNNLFLSLLPLIIPSIKVIKEGFDWSKIVPWNK